MTESRFMTPALSAIRGARNARSRSRNDRAITPPMKNGIRPAR
jgi:hypothetical protein